MKPLLFTLLAIISGISAIGQNDSTNASKSCDVITLKNGSLIYCRIKDVWPRKIEYRNCGDKADAPFKIIKSDSVFMVNYSNGTSEIIRSKVDTIRRPWVCFSASLGACTPGGPYADGRYSLYDRLYAGFATQGFCAAINAEIRNRKGWALALQENYYHNGSDLGGILGENGPTFYLNLTSYKTELYDDGISSITSNGAYSYNHFSFLVCPEKYIYMGHFSFYFHIGLGTLSFHVPAINGTVAMSGYDTVSKNQVTRSFNVNVAPENYSTALYNFGLGFEFRAYKGLFGKIGYDFAVATATIDGRVNMTDATGATVATGVLNTPLTVVFNNLTLGFGFGF